MSRLNSCDEELCLKCARGAPSTCKMRTCKKIFCKVCSESALVLCVGCHAGVCCAGRCAACDLPYCDLCMTRTFSPHNGATRCSKCPAPAILVEDDEEAGPASSDPLRDFRSFSVAQAAANTTPAPTPQPLPSRPRQFPTAHFPTVQSRPAPPTFPITSRTTTPPKLRQFQGWREVWDAKQQRTYWYNTKNLEQVMWKPPFDLENVPGPVDSDSAQQQATSGMSVATFIPAVTQATMATHTHLAANSNSNSNSNSTLQPHQAPTRAGDCNAWCAPHAQSTTELTDEELWAATERQLKQTAALWKQFTSPEGQRYYARLAAETQVQWERPATYSYLARLKVPQLQRMCRAKKLSYKGRKAEVVERMWCHLEDRCAPAIDPATQSAPTFSASYTHPVLSGPVSQVGHVLCPAPPILA